MRNLSAARALLGVAEKKHTLHCGAAAVFSLVCKKKEFYNPDESMWLHMVFSRTHCTGAAPELQ